MPTTKFGSPFWSRDLYSRVLFGIVLSAVQDLLRIENFIQSSRMCSTHFTRAHTGSTVILLCRPYRALSAAAKERCTEAARATDMLFTMHVRCFGFRCITWLQTYTMFVACTINVRDLKECQDVGGDTTLAHESRARLDFGMEILRQAGSTPSASRCALIISQLLQGQIPKK